MEKNIEEKNIEQKNIIENNIVEKNYWHIQMHLPNEQSGISIDSIKMLEEKEPVIGINEWDNIQFKNFKNENGMGLKVGDIILVREVQMILALCEVTGDSFRNGILERKYKHTHYRHVRVLEFYQGYEIFPQPQGVLSKLSTHKTKAYKFVDSWYKKLYPTPEQEISQEQKSEE